MQINRRFFIASLQTNQCLCLFLDGLGADGVEDVEEDGAGAAHVLLVVAVVDAGGAGERGGVDAALGLGVPPQLDVAVLAPHRAPGVADQPVVAFNWE